MEKILIYIKHNLKFLWLPLELVNSIVFRLLYSRKMDAALSQVLAEFQFQPYHFSRLSSEHLQALHNLIHSQAPADLTWFQPHGFDMPALQSQLRRQSFLMLGAFEGERLVGYFFLRFFANKKCFVGRLVAKPFRGKGISGAMNNIMYKTAWAMGFRCMGTISRNNRAIMQAHAKNPAMLVRKELQNDYLLVEFIQPAQSVEQNAKV